MRPSPAPVSQELTRRRSSAFDRFVESRQGQQGWFTLSLWAVPESRSGWPRRFLPGTWGPGVEQCQKLKAFGPIRLLGMVAATSLGDRAALAAPRTLNGKESPAMKKLTLLAGIAGLTLAALAAAAAPWGKGQGFGPCASAALGLTDDQQARIEALRDTCTKETSPLQSQLGDKKKELRALWAEATPDAEKIRATQKEISQLRDQLQDQSVQCRLDQRAILTPEQQQKFAGLGQGQGQGRGCGGGGCGGGGPGGGRRGGW